MSAERCYRALLRAYPSAFRLEYEREMLLTFRQCRRDASARPARFWFELLWDVARSAPALRLEAMRTRCSRDFHLKEGTMKAMAILATLVGVLEVVNSLIEGTGGWPNRDAAWMLSVACGIIGGAVLITAGIALLRRGTRATPHALGMAAMCLAAFAIIEFVFPVLSVFAMLLGIGFPIILMAFLFWRRGRDTARPSVA